MRHASEVEACDGSGIRQRLDDRRVVLFVSETILVGRHVAPDHENPSPVEGNEMTTYRLSPRVILQPGDRFRVSGGPYYKLEDGTKVPLAARGVFVLLAVDQGRRGRVQLLAYGSGGFAVIHVAGRRRSRVPGLVCRPYRVRRAAVQKNPRGRKKSA